MFFTPLARPESGEKQGDSVGFPSRMSFEPYAMQALGTVGLKACKPSSIGPRASDLYALQAFIHTLCHASLSYPRQP